MEIVKNRRAKNWTWPKKRVQPWRHPNAFCLPSKFAPNSLDIFFAPKFLRLEGPFFRLEIWNKFGIFSSFKIVKLDSHKIGPFHFWGLLSNNYLFLCIFNTDHWVLQRFSPFVDCPKFVPIDYGFTFPKEGGGNKHIFGFWSNQFLPVHFHQNYIFPPKIFFLGR